MIIKRNIVFDLENRKVKGEVVSENIPIRMRITYAGNRLEIFTGIRIDRNKWDAEKRKVKNNTFNRLKQSASDINAKLSEYETEIQNIFKKFELEERLPNNDDLKEQFNAIYSNQKAKNIKKIFFDYFDEFTSENGRLKNWTPRTHSKFGTVKNHLQKFNSKASFAFFNEKGLTEYVEYLRIIKGLRNSTIEKQIGFLRWFLKWAKSKGYNENFAFETFRPKLKATQKKIIFLTHDELKMIKDCVIPESRQYLHRVRDVFLFLCYTGIRYSDCNLPLLRHTQK